MTSLVLVEAAGLIDALLARCGNEPYRIMALYPAASVALADRNLPYEDADIHVPSEVLNGLGIDVLEQTDALLRRVCTVFQDAIPEFRETGFYGPWFAPRRFSLLAHVILGKACEIGMAIDAAAPDKVIFGSALAATKDFDVPFTNESLDGQIIEILCRTRNIPYENVQFDYDSTVTKHRDLLNEAAAPVRPDRNWRWALNAVKRRVRYVYGRIATKVGAALVPGTRPTVVVQGEMGLEPHLPHRTKLHPYCGPKTSAISPRIETALKACWDQIQQLPEYTTLLQWQGADLRPIAAPYMQVMLGTQTAELFGFFQHALGELKRVSAHALVCGTPGDRKAKMAAHAALRLGLPTFTRPHGHIGPCILPGMHYEETILFTHYLLSCPGQVKFIERESNVPTKTIVTGSHDLDVITATQGDRNKSLRSIGLDPDLPTVIISLPGMDGSRRYYPFLTESDLHKIRMEQRILEVLAEHPSLQVIVKGHPGPSGPVWPLHDWAQERLGKRYRYIWNGSYQAMLDWADAFIVTHVMTTFAQAMTRQAPIYCFNQALVFYEDAKKYMIEHEMLFEDIDVFCGVLAEDLRSGKALRKKSNRDAFFNFYVDSFADGQSSKRMADAVFEEACRVQRDGYYTGDLVAEKMSGGPFFDRMRSCLDASAGLARKIPTSRHE